jgi:hypothetical protein
VYVPIGDPCLQLEHFNHSATRIKKAGTAISWRVKLPPSSGT